MSSEKQQTMKNSINITPTDGLSSLLPKQNGYISNTSK